MSIARAEELKRELTDKYVVVRDGVAELRRFAGLTGKVKTVNMSCRALVQFDGPVDISWYDIDPGYLTVVDQPLPKKTPVAHEKPAKAAATPASKPAATAGQSPLELARQQAAAKAATSATSASTGEKKLSPLELARQQGAAKTAPTGSASPAPAVAPAGEKKLSPLEMARLQGAGKSAPAPAAAATPPAPPLPEPIVAATPAAAAPPAVQRVTPGTTAEIIALARQQGAFKG